MFASNRFLDAVLTGAAAYALMLAWAACSGGGASGGFAPDGGAGTFGAGGTNPVIGEANAEQSGSRLKARRLHGADGSTQFVGWFDSARGEECALYLTPEGKRRCLPSGPNVYLSSSGYFVDPACTIPGGDRKAGCPPLKYLGFWADSSSCGSSGLSGIYEAVPAPKLYYKSSDGSCSPSSPSDGYEIFGAGKPVPFTDFVEAAEKLDP